MATVKVTTLAGGTIEYTVSDETSVADLRILAGVPEDLDMKKGGEVVSDEASTSVSDGDGFTATPAKASSGI